MIIDKIILRKPNYSDESGHAFKKNGEKINRMATRGNLSLDLQARGLFDIPIII